MKALVLEEYNRFVYKDVAVPVYNDEEVLIRIKACAVCGSDVHGMDGSTGRRIPPLIMGHEAAGTIEACGRNVAEYKPGDRVTFDSTIYCNSCHMCATGRTNLCGDRRVLGVSCAEYHMDGAFAEYVAVPQHILYKLPDNVTFQQAAMIEPLSIAYHAVTRTPVRAGDSVMMVGVGTIGMLALQLAVSMGASEVIAVDVDENRLKTARENGASFCCNSGTQDAVALVRAHLREKSGVDIAIDATGIEATVNICVDAVSLGGRVVLVGNLAKSVELPLQTVVTREISLFGSCSSAGEYGECLKLIADGSVDVDAIVSKIVPLSEGGEWIARVRDKEEGLYKIILEM